MSFPCVMCAFIMGLCVNCVCAFAHSLLFFFFPPISSDSVQFQSLHPPLYSVIHLPQRCHLCVKACRCASPVSGMQREREREGTEEDGRRRREVTFAESLRSQAPKRQLAQALAGGVELYCMLLPHRIYCCARVETFVGVTSQKSAAVQNGFSAHISSA